MKQQIIVVDLIDWSESFTSLLGTFYCGSTDEQKMKTVDIIEVADIVLNATDLHPVTSYEYKIRSANNGAQFVPMGIT